MKIRPTILMVGQLPPPFHGQAMMNQMVFEADYQEFDTVVLPMSFSETAEQVGKASFSKVLHLCSLILRTWWLWLRHRPVALYYPPASANRVPIGRDIVYLGCTRFLFSKTIFHFHAGGLVAFMQNQAWLGRLARWVYRRPDLSIELYREPDSPGVFLKARKVGVIANAVAVGQQKGSPKGGVFTILYVGALSEEKGVLEVIRVVAELRSLGVEVVAQLAGSWVSAEFREKALKLVAECEVEPQIRWLGCIQGEQKWQVFNNSDCFFFPTCYSAEKFPLVLLEAMGMSLPVVSTHWRGIPQLVAGSDAAVLCEVGDQEGFVDAIAKLAKQPEYRQRLADHARKHYLNHYTVEKFLQSIEQSLLDVVQHG